MSDAKRPGGRQRRAQNTIQTSTGKTIKLQRSFSDRVKARRFARSTRKAEYLSTLPKEPWKRVLYRLHPKRVAKYWFSREGAIMALKITGIGIVAGFLIVIGLFAYFRKDLPKINDISGDKIGGSITYYDRTGQTVLWQDYDAIKRIPVKDDQISPFMKNATVAVEDKDFYKHGAFDVRGILRAGIHDAVGSGGTQGGSTITQQLVKLNEQWTDNRTITRKVKELILAVELEREYSKDDILTAYLNVAPYGGVENGVESAARDYFGVGAKDLTLSQAAMLAAIPKSPFYYSPYNSTQFNPAAGDSFDKQALAGRMQYIYKQMVSQHMITQKQADDAIKVDILAQVKALQPKYQGIKAPYFVLAAKQELQNKYGATTVQRGGWKVTTTLDTTLQSTAEQLVATNASNLQKRTGGLADEQATVTEDVQTGQIVALVGGTDFSNADHGQNNYAASVLIPPGSSFKPYDYTTLIDNNNNVGASSVIYDQDTVLPGYPCTNHGTQKQGGNCLKDYDFLQPGAITLRYALGGSRNVPAVKAMLSAVPNDNSPNKVNSVNKVISTATAMMDNPYVKGKTYNCYGDEQLTVTTQCYGASAIGDGAFLHLDDHVNGLSTLGRLGNAIPKTYILQINDSGGKTIYKWQQPKGKQAIKQDSAYIVDNMASDPNASYLPGSCTPTNCTALARGGYKFHRDNGSTFAIKTGTTNDGFDGLMTSWSSKYAVVSWVGNHQRNVDISKYGATMELLTEPLTRGMMEAAHAGKTPATWTQPADIKVASSFVQRSHVHFGDIEPGPSTDLYPAWYTGGNKTTNTSAVTDKVSGKTATSCTPDLAKDNQANGNAASWNIDIFNGGKASTGGSSSSTGTAANSTDDVHNCSDAPPSVTLTAPSSCDSSGCSITVTASQGTHGLSGGTYTAAPAGTISVSVDGQVVKTFTMDQTDVYSSSFTYIPTSSGDAQVTATVVDSVLYSGSDSKTVNFSASNPIKFGSAHLTGSNKLTVTWSGGTGLVTVTRGGSTVCTATASAGQCSDTSPTYALIPHQVTISDGTSSDNGSY
jgi:membrane peptidoglycan carboxypeptidase